MMISLANDPGWMRADGRRRHQRHGADVLVPVEEGSGQEQERKEDEGRPLLVTHQVNHEQINLE